MIDWGLAIGQATNLLRFPTTLTSILGDKTLGLEFLNGHLGRFGEEDHVPIFVPHPGCPKDYSLRIKMRKKEEIGPRAGTKILRVKRTEPIRVEGEGFLREK